MIPGTTLALGGGGALSRDVGGSGNLQQSPLQYRGSGDTVQTIEGLRLNNLCAQRRLQRRLLERRQLPGNQLRDRRRLGRNGPGRHARQHGAEGRRQHVPRHRVRQLRADGWASDNCGSPAIGQPCTRSNLTGDTTFNPNNNVLTNVSRARRRSGTSIPAIGGPIVRDKVWFNSTFRYWGVNKTVADSFFDADPSPFRYVADTSRPGIDDGHIRSNAGARLVAGEPARTRSPYYHDEQDKVRGHWGIASNDPARGVGHPGDADQLRVGVASGRARRPTGCCSTPASASTTRSTRRSISRTSSPARDAAGHAASTTAPARSRARGTTRPITSRSCSPSSSPPSYVTGSHSLRFGATISQANWRLAQQCTGDVAADHLQRPAAERQPQSGQRHAAHPDRSPQLDQERQRRVRAGQVDDQARHGQRRLPLGLVHQRDRPGNAASQHVEPARSLTASAPTARTTSTPAASDGSPTGRTSARASASRTTCSATAGPRIKASVRALRQRRRPGGAAASPTTTTRRRRSA